MQENTTAHTKSANASWHTIVYACDDAYWEHVFVSMYSLVVENPDLMLDIRILAETPDARFFHGARLLERSHGNVRISWLPVGNHAFRDTPTGVVGSHSTYYRLMLGSLLPPDITRVLFIDADTVVRGSIRDLLNTSLGGAMIAATPQHPFRPAPLPPVDYAGRIGLRPGSWYFNAGVMLIDLEAWRAADVESQSHDYVRSRASVPGALDHADQDVLNVVLEGKWKALGTEFNFAEWTVVPRSFEAPSIAGDGNDGPVIVHFSGHRKPWHGGTRNPYEPEYWRYRMRTPYADWFKLARSRVMRLVSMPLRFARALMARPRERKLMAHRGA